MFRTTFGPRPTRLRLLAAVTAALGCAVTVSSCAGPDGVDLGTDWKGAQVFVLAKVNGEVTVVGINPVKGTAESLAVVPQQSDDDSVLAPQILQQADGNWLVSVPRKGGKASRLYAIDRKEKTLAKVGEAEELRELVPGKSLMGQVDGLATVRKSGQDKGRQTTSVLVTRSASGAVVREAHVPGTVTLAASGAATDRVCLVADSAGHDVVSTLDLSSGNVEGVGETGLANVSALACADGRPVVAGAPEAKTSLKGVSVRQTAQSMVLTSGDGEISRVAADGPSVVAVQAAGDAGVLFVRLGSDGKVQQQVKVSGLSSAEGLHVVDRGWVLTEGDRAAVVDVRTGKSTSFALPGDLLAAD
ncbi:hypothetical protein OG936_20435 [Streptomyces sp. NBC_00846]|uniref:hypothetical protein n=1 Tax=Streptomyces sp. NBC_00846 TaxID=2975849 RepID=UPI00386EBB1E|nr:hypothetical protein OG936_20435 [Streptomyces sp. NBC_00846]